MRFVPFALAPLLLAASITPAAAQVSATIHIGPIRIGGGADHYRGGYPPRVVVVDYPDRYYGSWRHTAPHWRPITVYYLGGHYYERPYRNARPVVIYRYRDHYFFGPRDRDWDRYRSRYEQRDWRQWRDPRGGGWRDDWRGDRRDDRYDRRDDRRDDRYDRRDDRYDRRGGNVRRNEHRDGRPGGNIRRSEVRGNGPPDNRARRRNG